MDRIELIEEDERGLNSHVLELNFENGAQKSDQGEKYKGLIFMNGGEAKEEAKDERTPK